MAQCQGRVRREGHPELAAHGDHLALNRLATERPIVEIHLAGEHDILALHAETLEGTPDELLAGAVCVNVSGVDEVHPELESAGDDRLSLLFVREPLMKIREDLAKAHAPEAQLADLNVGGSKVCVLHGSKVHRMLESA